MCRETARASERARERARERERERDRERERERGLDDVTGSGEKEPPPRVFFCPQIYEFMTLVVLSTSFCSWLIHKFVLFFFGSEKKTSVAGGGLHQRRLSRYNITCVCVCVCVRATARGAQTGHIPNASLPSVPSSLPSSHPPFLPSSPQAQLRLVIVRIEGQR
jgi:hypothetical protein